MNDAIGQTGLVQEVKGHNRAEGVGKDGDSSSHFVEVWVAPDKLSVLDLDDCMESL